MARLVPLSFSQAGWPSLLGGTATPRVPRRPGACLLQATAAHGGTCLSAFTVRNRCATCSFFFLFKDIVAAFLALRVLSYAVCWYRHAVTERVCCSVLLAPRVCYRVRYMLVLSVTTLSARVFVIAH